MGRPIKKIFIGERSGAGAGGSGLASVTISNGGTGYAAGTLVISAPDLEGGVQAVGHILSAAGAIDSSVITTAGSGYTSPPTVTAPTGTIGTGTLTAVLTVSATKVILATAFIPVADGGTAKQSKGQ